MKNTLVFAFFLLLTWQNMASAQEKKPAAVRPLPQAHAHNDYEHARPLFDALAHGFTSVEADIYLLEGELYVSHDKPARLDSSRTLKALYLEPLRQRIENNGGAVYPGYPDPFYLMIDIKTEAEATYAVLSRQLIAYRSFLTSYQGNETTVGPCLIFLSGNRPIATVQGEQERLVALDGRPGDLGKGYVPALMPVISENYHKVVKWRGKGKIAPDQWSALRQLADQAAAEGKKLRLWATPEKEQVWKTLLKAGVDFLNTDELASLQHFLLRQGK